MLITDSVQVLRSLLQISASIHMCCAAKVTARRMMPVPRRQAYKNWTNLNGAFRTRCLLSKLMAHWSRSAGRPVLHFLAQPGEMRAADRPGASQGAAPGAADARIRLYARPSSSGSSSIGLGFRLGDIYWTESPTTEYCAAISVLSLKKRGNFSSFPTFRKKKKKLFPYTHPKRNLPP